MKQVRSYGAWPSEILSERIAAGALRLSQPRLDRGWIYWLEARPTEAGRQVVVRARPGRAAEEVTPSSVNVRTLVHEYGGGDYTVCRGDVFYVDFAEQRVRGTDGEPISPAGPRYADLVPSPDGRWLLAVEERPRAGGEPENSLVAFDLGGSRGAEPLPVAGGHDFVSSPCFSPDGSRVAFLAWEHPDMPWDSTRLFVLEWGAGGPTGAPRAVAGGPGESVYQPRFAPDGVLTFVADRSGWWNLYQLRESGPVPLCPRAAEFGRPQWGFGMSSYDFVDAGRLLCSYGVGGEDRLAVLHVESGELDDLPLPLGDIGGVRVEEGVACFVGAGPATAPGIYRLALADRELSLVKSGLSLEVDASSLSRPEAFEFESAGGRTAHAFFYPPASALAEGPSAERAPLLVKSHGGPTAAASSALDLRMQYWASRGVAVVDVNYGGSTGYGREYRERLAGQWGIVDVEDCIYAARTLAAQGRVDPGRLAISGGSAGGYTTLCSLVFHDDFAAGASYYGIGDLEALVRDTHKFESRYMDKLVGPYPEEKARYRERSPIHFTERLACPVIFFQGLEDKVVPPNQAEAMVEALAARGIPHAYVPFAGEQHGFRRAENISTALNGELYFYSRVFGFEVTRQPEAVRIVGGP